MNKNIKICLKLWLPFTYPVFKNTKASCLFNMHGQRVSDAIPFICKGFKIMCCCFGL